MGDAWHFQGPHACQKCPGCMRAALRGASLFVRVGPAARAPVRVNITPALSHGGCVSAFRRPR